MFSWSVRSKDFIVTKLPILINWTIQKKSEGVLYGLIYSFLFCYISFSWILCGFYTCSFHLYSCIQLFVLHLVVRFWFICTVMSKVIQSWILFLHPLLILLCFIQSRLYSNSNEILRWTKSELEAYKKLIKDDKILMYCVETPLPTQLNQALFCSCTSLFAF